MFGSKKRRWNREFNDASARLATYSNAEKDRLIHSYVLLGSLSHGAPTESATVAAVVYYAAGNDENRIQDLYSKIGNSNEIYSLWERSFGWTHPEGEERFAAWVTEVTGWHEEEKAS